VLVILVVAVAVSSIVALARANPEKGSRAVVEAGGRQVDTYKLGNSGTPERFSVRGDLGIGVFEIENGRVRMVSSPCRDKICIHRGRIDQAGETIICLPNRVAIRVLGQARVDALSE